jgi:V/A-type H+-transporting ATPase subunit C
VIKIKSENQFSDQTYSMVKSFVIRGDIITYQNLENLAESKSLEEFIIRMKGTKYSDVISKIQPPYNTRKIEKSLKRRLIEIHKAILKVTPKKKLLRAYYLKYISGNLKVLLKGRAQNKQDDDIKDYIDMYAEELIGRRDLLARAFSSESLEQMIEILKDSEFGDEARNAFEIFKKTGKFQIFDVYIDKAYYKRIIESFFSEHKKDSRIKDIVSVDADSYNILAVLRGRKWELDSLQIKDLLVEPFFDIKESHLKKMINAGSESEVIKILNQTPYRKLITETEDFEATISSIEDNSINILATRALNPFLWDIHKTSIALGAVKLSEMEVKNLSRIAFGVEQRMSFKKIMSQILSLK